RGVTMRAKLSLVIGTLVMLGATGSQARAHWGVGVHIGIPLFFPPCYSYYHYYPPYPVYVQPAPVYVQPAPVVYQQIPVYAQPAPVVAQSAPPPLAQTTAPAPPVKLAAAQTPIADDRQT